MAKKPAALDSKTAGLRNEKLVLTMLATYGNQSQSQICQLTGLSSSTISYIVGRLREKSLILEERGRSAKRGAKPVMLSINPQSRYIVAVEISPSNLFLGLFDFSRHLVDSIKVNIVDNLQPEHVCNQMEINLRGLLSKHAVPESKLLGIGVTLSGSVSSSGLVELSSPLGWKQVPLGDRLQQRFQAPISIHATRVRLLAEESIHQPHPPKNILYLNVGNGVGGHVIIDGHLVHGATNRSCEIGHVVVDPHGPQCGCGNHGCLESFISGPALARKIVKDIQSGRTTWLKKAIRPDMIPEEIIAQWGHALTKNDPYALEIRDFLAAHLSHAAAIAINICDPHIVLLAGYVTQQCCDFLIQQIKSRINGEVYDSLARKIRIIPAQAGEQALIRGVVVAILQNSIEIT